MKTTAKNFTMVSNDVLRSCVSGDVKIVYCILKSYNPSHPSNLELMKLTGYGRNKIVRIKKQLKELGWVTWKRRRNNSNEYEIKKFEQCGEFHCDTSIEFHHDTSNNTNNKRKAAGENIESNDTNSDSFTTKLSKTLSPLKHSWQMDSITTKLSEIGNCQDESSKILETQTKENETSNTPPVAVETIIESKETSKNKMDKSLPWILNNDEETGTIYGK